MRVFTLSTEEFRQALERAARDDDRWPFLEMSRWLLDHAKSKDGVVILTVIEGKAPRPPTA